MSVAAADEPEPTNADLMAALQQFADEFLARIVEIRTMLASTGSRATPEPLPDGVQDAPPMRGFLCDEEDGG